MPPRREELRVGVGEPLELAEVFGLFRLEAMSFRRLISSRRIISVWELAFRGVGVMTSDGGGVMLVEAGSG